MTIILTGLVIGVLIGSAIIIHGYINDRTMLEMQQRQQASQDAIQRRQQKHEMEFAEQQAKMFRENSEKARKAAKSFKEKEAGTAIPPIT